MIINFSDAGGPGMFQQRSAGDAFVVLFCLWWLLLIIFSAFPGIDLALARMFFQQQQCLTPMAGSKVCGYFPYNDSPTFNLLRQALFALPYLAAGILCWALFRRLREHGATYDVTKARNLKIALGSLIIGPIIIVNVWLKAFSGRPRPHQTDLFGGPLDFVQAGSFAGKCVANCSFISGEAASAGWLLCLIPIIPQPARTALALPIVAASILMPALRVAFGAHYLSDAVLGWLSSLVVFAGLLALSQTAHGLKIYKD